jgi:hypothetical protein
VIYRKTRAINVSVEIGQNIEQATPVLVTVNNRKQENNYL